MMERIKSWNVRDDDMMDGLSDHVPSSNEVGMHRKLWN
jgi:hypothetical protein